MAHLVREVIVGMRCFFVHGFGLKWRYFIVVQDRATGNVILNVPRARVYVSTWIGIGSSIRNRSRESLRIKTTGQQKVQFGARHTLSRTSLVRIFIISHIWRTHYIFYWALKKIFAAARWKV